MSCAQTHKSASFVTCIFPTDQTKHILWCLLHGGVVGPVFWVSMADIFESTKNFLTVVVHPDPDTSISNPDNSAFSSIEVDFSPNKDIIKKGKCI